jgi:FtsZ-binding cell division protein ZapB
MNEDLKLTAEVMQASGGWVDRPTAIDRLHEAITRLRAEIEALKSDVSDLVRAGSDEATENERLVKERDEALAEIALWNGKAVALESDELDGLAAKWPRVVKVMLDAERRAETAEAQRDAALEALEAVRAGSDEATENERLVKERDEARMLNDMLIAAARTLDTVKDKT